MEIAERIKRENVTSRKLFSSSQRTQRQYHHRPRNDARPRIKVGRNNKRSLKNHKVHGGLEIQNFGARESKRENNGTLPIL